MPLPTELTVTAFGRQGADATTWLVYNRGSDPIVDVTQPPGDDALAVVTDAVAEHLHLRPESVRIRRRTGDIPSLSITVPRRFRVRGHRNVEVTDHLTNQFVSGHTSEPDALAAAEAHEQRTHLARRLYGPAPRDRPGVAPRPDRRGGADSGPDAPRWWPDRRRG